MTENEFLFVLYLGIQIVAVLFALRAVKTARTPQGSVGWVVFLFAAPHIAVPIYLFLGHKRYPGYITARREMHREIASLRALTAENAPRRTSVAAEDVGGRVAAFERLGSPEGELALVQAVLYLAIAPKSNAVYRAAGEARRFVREHGTQAVPMHLRNAPTKLMKQIGAAQGYRYAHDEPGAFAAGERYFPEALPEARLYRPTERGQEARIAERMAELQRLNRQARAAAASSESAPGDKA
ncbi:replication-associated recombination protein A [mine drainage metagenome]|uniref:Replication-associated recombination protein A n=1 Tax=mine drainage metagenome TaxID=410659 RepID=A0A1J5S112_9ZZZZ